MGNRISADIAVELLRAFFEGEWEYTNEDLGINGIKIKGEIIHLFLVGLQ